MPSTVAEGCSSSHSTSTQRSYTYHVFLSFRGGDTRKGFTDHLCASLERKGIRTFKDEKDLQRGEVISDELKRAIQESMFAITVLSPNYASSAWCLDELQKIAECSKNMGLFLVPVFYGVEPCDVRHQKGRYEEAFRKHESRFGQGSDKVERWRDALREVASHSGWDYKDQHEATFVESIVQHIHRKLIPKLPSCTENLVGITSRVEEVIKLVGIGLNDVRFVGIWGMGGIGKSTIARAVYEAIQGEFQVCCFLANVREKCEAGGLFHIQKELVAHMNISTSSLRNVYDGQRIIRHALCNKKILLVLDDVSEERQLEYLAGKQDWFGPGSRVIITTRDSHLLKLHGVHGTYEVGCLVQNEAFCFFCLKAFKQDQHVEGYLEMSNEVVSYTGGLPLALKVLGSYLHGRSVDVWRSAVKKIKSGLNPKILETLEISYEGLDSMEKNIFLDIACFFKGWEKDQVIDILEKCGYNPQIEIDILIERSLITLSRETNVLDMHDLLQEMGKNIVVQESPNDPGKRSRLWSKADIDLVINKNKGTETIQGMVLSSGYYSQLRWNPAAFSNMRQLKLLILRSVIDFPLGLHYLPSSLKVFHWNNCPLKTLPLSDQELEYVEIKLQYSKIEHLWHGKKFLEKLKHMDLSFSWELKQIPDLSAVPILETLVLKNCSDLTEVHPSISCHKNLILLDLTSCISIKTLPGKLEMRSLKELILSNCFRFQSLPEFGQCMKRLSKLSLNGTAIRKLPASIGCLVALEYLNLYNCTKLVSLPVTIHGLKSLRILNASCCSKLCLPNWDELCSTELRLQTFISRLPFLSCLDLSYCDLTEQSFPHDDFCYLPSLMDLNLDGNNFVSIPITILELPKLRCLSLNNCRKLQFLPELPSTARELEACNCDSLNTIAELNTLSKVSSVFLSPIQECGQVFSFLISGWEIPSSFVHQEDGNSVTVPMPHSLSLNGWLGIVLCFRIKISGGPPYNFKLKRSLTESNCKGFIAQRVLGGLSLMEPGYYLYVFYLSYGCFSDDFHQGNHWFELSFEDNPCDVSVLSSGARLVVKQDIEVPFRRKVKKNTGSGECKQPYCCCAETHPQPQDNE